MRDKIQLLFIPTLLVLLAMVFIYTFLHWVLFIQLEIFPVKPFITNFVIPAVLGGLAALIVLRPRLKILNFDRSEGNWRDFYNFILWIVLTTPVIIAQEYIVTASGNLTEMNSISEINTHQRSKYYTVKKYYLDRKNIAMYPDFEVSGKHNENFNMHIYGAVPIFESAAEATRGNNPAWLGIEFKRSISNRLAPEEKQRRYEIFALTCERDFKAKKSWKFMYLDRIGHSDEREGLIEAVRLKTGDSNPIILCPVNEPFEARNGTTLAWIGGSAAIGLSVWLIMLAISPINRSQLARIREGKPDRQAQEEWKDAIGLVKPREGYFITPILIHINVLIFILMVIAGLGFGSFKATDLLHWGANYGPATKSGELWRLFTSMFLHGGVMHVLANMYGLLFVGIFLEPLLGKTKFLAVYLAAGIIGSVASIAWYDATVSVGASGAIFGLYGFFLSAILTKLFPMELGKAFLWSTVIFVGYNLLMGLVGGIDNAAHIGGLVSGFIIGLLLYQNLKEQTAEEGV
jgi:rhomboid protease GluP